MPDYMQEVLGDLVALHNDARRNKWLWKAEPLVRSELLSQYAQDWANKMAVNGRLTHSSMSDIMKLGYTAVAENIAYGQKSPEEVMDTWMNSSGHKKNILNSKFNAIGCGLSLSSNGRPYWCVCFGKV